MAKSKFEWDYDAAGDLMLRSDAIAAICEAEAERMTRATGVEYIPDVRMGKQRVSASARTAADSEIAKKESGGQDSRTGRIVKGYWRTGKGGKKTWVQSYRRKS